MIKKKKSSAYLLDLKQMPIYNNLLSTDSSLRDEVVWVGILFSTNGPIPTAWARYLYIALSIIHYPLPITPSRHCEERSNPEYFFYKEWIASFLAMTSGDIIHYRLPITHYPLSIIPIHASS